MDNGKTPGGEMKNVTIFMREFGNGRPLHTGSNSRSLNDLNRAIESNPKHVDEYFERAQLFIEKKEYWRAIDDYNRAMNNGYNNATIRATALSSRGCVFLIMKDYDSVINDCTKAIAIDPSCVPGYFNRGSAYFMKKQYKPAISDCAEAIRLAPNLVGAWDMRGDAYMFEGNSDLAIADYSRVVKLNPTLVKTYLKRGEAFYHKQNYKGAIEDYDQAVKLGRADPHLFYNLGCACYKNGEYDRAIVNLNEGIRLDPNIAEIWRVRDLVYSAKGDNK
jgi:tetratricopeptide (TPR) repeat protein